MNIAMILEMAADALGDRLAYGTRADGLSYEGLRQAARGIAERVDGTGAERLALMESNAPIVPATMFGAAWAGVSYAPLNYRLPEAQLEALLGRIEPAVVAAPHWLDNKGSSDRAFPDSPDSPAVILFTSGTSAEPKAAILEHDQLLAYIFNTLEFASAGEDEAAVPDELPELQPATSNAMSSEVRSSATSRGERVKARPPRTSSRCPSGPSRW